MQIRFKQINKCIRDYLTERTLSQNVQITGRYIKIYESEVKLFAKLINILKQFYNRLFRKNK